MACYVARRRSGPSYMRQHVVDSLWRPRHHIIAWKYPVTCPPSIRLLVPTDWTIATASWDSRETSSIATRAGISDAVMGPVLPWLRFVMDFTFRDLLLKTGSDSLAAKVSNPRFIDITAKRKNTINFTTRFKFFCRRCRGAAGLAAKLLDSRRIYDYSKTVLCLYWLKFCRRGIRDLVTTRRVTAR